MPLLTLEQVAEDLGLKSPQSVRNLAARGAFRILSIVITGTRGSPRVDADELDAYKERIRSGGPASAPQAAPTAATGRPATRPRASRRKAPVPPAFRALQRAQRQGKVMHFE